MGCPWCDAVLTDTHCHLDLEDFDEDRPAVIERAVQAGVGRILIPGLSASSSEQVVQLAQNQPMLFAAIGVHPNEAYTWNAQSQEILKQLAKDRKVVAIGEIGLDYYRERAARDLQLKILGEQLNLAEELQLPVVIHLREETDKLDGPAGSNLLMILDEWVSRLRLKKSQLAERPGVMHSFSSSLETAEKAIHLGFFIGVTGPVTFKNAISRQEVVEALPLERILIETDAPFLTPVPHRGQRNEPAYVQLIAKKIAEIHSRSQEEVAAMTTANAARLFSWGEPI